jgi:hypothetical protein
MTNEMIRRISDFAFMVVPFIGAWCLLYPGNFVSKITFGRVVPSRVALWALRVAGGLMVLGGLLSLLEDLWKRS